MLETRARTFTEGETMRLAAELYLQERTWSRGEKALQLFCCRWGSEKTETVRDAPRAHVPDKMTDAECEACINELRAGWTTTWGEHRWFITLDHAAAMRNGSGWQCPTLHAMRQRYSDTHPEGMWARLRRYDPQLKEFSLHPREALSDVLKQERINACRFYLRQPLSFFKRIFFFDAKTIYVCAATQKVIGYSQDVDGRTYCATPIYYYNGITHTKELIKVQFYSMVNWYGGMCGFWICQGSTRVAPVYKVITSGEGCKHTGVLLAIHAICQRLLQCTCPGVAAVVGVQAQHAPPRRYHALVECSVSCCLVLPVCHRLLLVCDAIHLDAQPLLQGEIHACIHRARPPLHPVLERPHHILSI